MTNLHSMIVNTDGPSGTGAPETSADFEAGYRALTTGAALIDRTGCSRILLAGKDVLDLLNRLSTNSLLDLSTGAAMGSVLTSDRGRIVDVLLIVRRAEHELLLLSGAPSSQASMDWIDRFTFDEDARLKDISPETVQMAIAGPEAQETVRRMAGRAAASLGPNAYLQIDIAGVRADVVRTDSPGPPCWEFIVPVSEREPLTALARVEGAELAGLSAWESVRTEMGVPAQGHEFTGEANPLEAGIKHLVSFTKGCYVGQEVIARLDTYDKVQRILAGLVSDAPLTPGAALTSGGHDAGRITSAAYSPSLRRQIGLGLVRRSHADAGSRLDSPSGPVTIAPLPLKLNGPA